MNTKYQGGDDNGKQIRSRKRKSHPGYLGRKDNLIIKEKFHADLKAGRRVLRTYANSSFMTWDGGSSLIFWRWPPDSRVLARDGMVPYFIGSLPCNMRAPKRMKEADTEKLVEKILTCLEKGYLVFTHKNEVDSYID